MFTNLENLKKAIESNDKKEARKVLAIMCNENEYTLARRLLKLMVREELETNTKKALFALDLLPLIDNRDARESLIINEFIPLHRTGDADGGYAFIIFNRNEPKENVFRVMNYYGMDESYYNGIGYGFGNKPEIIKKGSRILVKQYRGLDI